MKIPNRIAQTLINSLKGGVVPRVGLPYITVGRKAEIEALLRDVEMIADGGASFRFIVGKYGSGSTARRYPRGWIRWEYPDPDRLMRRGTWCCRQPCFLRHLP